MDNVSYALGVLLANNLKQQGLDKIEVSDFSEAFGEVILGKETTMNMQQANEIVQRYMSEGVNAKNKAEGEAYLAANAKKDGVTVLASGMQYEVLKEGDGPKPKATDTVTTHYHGTLIDGRVFDSSVERGEPASFPVNGVIQGWVQALQMMPVGSKWRLHIPSQLAYGDRGAGQMIGPGTTLVFEVELLKIA